MNILLTKHFRDEAKKYDSHENISVHELVDFLESVSRHGIDGNPNIHRVNDISEEIYVAKYKGIMIFLTKKNGDLVVLSILKK